MPQRVRFAILGVGYMGRTAIGALDELRRRDDVAQSFRIELCAVAEPDSNVRERTKQFVDLRECQVMQYSHEALTRVVELSEEDGAPAIVYDGTSPLDRPLNLEIVLDARRDGLPITLIGEKPIAVTVDDLAVIERYDERDEFFCEFIEMGNDAFIALKRYLEEERLSIDRIACWRANSSGIRKALGGGRLGVVGGALLDKAAHDVAIVASLLQSERASVASAEVHHIVPYSETGWFTVSDEVQYGNDPSRWLADQVFWPADGTASVSSTWKSGRTGNEIPATFVWGWHGLTGIKQERELADVLTHLKHDRPYTLAHVVDLVEEQKAYRKPESGLFGDERVFLDDDVRLIVIWSGAHTIICNLLGKDYKKENTRLERYVIDYIDGEAHVVYDPAERDPQRDLSRINRRDLAEVFLCVLQAEENVSASRDVARKRAQFVHRFVFEAQQKAIGDMASRKHRFQDILSDSIDLIRSKLKAQGEPRVNKAHGEPAPWRRRPARR